jgi:hypothetical protein
VKSSTCGALPVMTSEAGSTCAPPKRSASDDGRCSPRLLVTTTGTRASRAAIEP